MGLQYALLFLVVILGVFPQTKQDSDINVSACVDEDVTLPCNFTPHMTELKWQRNEKSIYNINRYEGRIDSFQTDTNCSILLKNVNKDDGGIYLNSFKDNGIYFRNTVNLTVKDCPRNEGRDSPSTDNHPSADQPGVLVALIIVPALLLFGCIVFTLWKRRRNQQHRQDQLDANSSISDVSSEHVVLMENPNLPEKSGFEHRDLNSSHPV